MGQAHDDKHLQAVFIEIKTKQEAKYPRNFLFTINNILNVLEVFFFFKYIN